MNLDDRLLLLGSCFSDRIADKMRESYLRVTANPTGTLYNPVSIAHHIDDYAPQADVIIVTFGTAWVYIDKHLSAVVDNCEKRPASDFIRRRLTVNEIVTLWQPILERYKDKRWIFTVSPIRHKKDGLHENQLSKAILLQAVDLLERTKEPAVHYFPSYEVVLDELRDYRYYAPDMLHPSEVAVDIIWERFCGTYFDDATLRNMNRLHQLWLDEHHRPLLPDTPEAKAFAAHLEQEKYELHKLFPNHVTL
ncbi:MAG: GSCFA domain-containing protein [Paludibacteraceae bacterium]|nr:GSCFA domain-containing protein [Paludibacteraceae bacterium]